MPASDLLLHLASRPRGAALLRRLGLPSPVALHRATGGWAAQPLAGQQLVVAGLGERDDLLSLTSTLQSLGAQLDLTDEALINGALLDARALDDPRDLSLLPGLFQRWLPRLAPRARLVVLIEQPHTDASAASHATAAALGGFIRSLGKEIGRKGAAINAVMVPAQGSPALVSSVTFLLSARSGFVAGQTLSLGPAAEPAASPVLWNVPALPGHCAVVTGAAQGIGRAVAERLAEEGARVLCVDMPSQQAQLQTLADAIGGQSLCLDITATDAGEQLVDAVKAIGPLDIMVHNAGITRDRTLARLSTHDWEAVLAVGLSSVLALDQALDGAAAWGSAPRTVCLSSINGIAGAAGQTHYAAAKAGLIGYVQARSCDVAALGGVINAVAPGFIETAMTASLPRAVTLAGRRLSSLSQGGQPRDVAEAIAFLASPHHGGINGQVLRVCGQSFIGA